MFFRKSADMGYASTQYRLGMMYYKGEGTAKDYKAAYEWYSKAAEYFRKAAKEGIAEAQYFIGLMYLYGRGIPKDYGLAADWLRQASLQGIPQAALADMLKKGQGVRQDCGTSYQWLITAARSGYPHAQWKMGEFYIDGVCRKADAVQAYRWFKTADGAGHKTAGASMLALRMVMTDREIAAGDKAAADWVAFGTKVSVRMAFISILRKQ